MNTALTIDRTPSVIAAEINSIKSQTRNIILQGSIEIGRRLAEAKALVQHGQWGEWLETNVEYSQSTANNLMRIYEEYGNNQLSLFDSSNSQALANLSYTQAVALLGIPAYEREQFVEEHNVEALSTRELQELIRERDEAKAQKQKAEAEAATARGERDKLNSEIEHEKTLLTSLQEQMERERMRARADVERLATELRQAQEKALPPSEQLYDKAKARQQEEQVQKLQQELDEARQKVHELTEEMAKPVTIETAVVERVPEHVERELEQLRAHVQRQRDSEATLKYKMQFEGLVAGFKGLLSTLEGMRSTDPDVYEKYRSATAGLLTKMQAGL